MTEADKLREIAIQVQAWRIELAKLDRQCANYPTDLNTARFVTYAEHISQMEKILYDRR